MFAKPCFDHKFIQRALPAGYRKTVFRGSYRLSEPCCPMRSRRAVRRCAIFAKLMADLDISSIALMSTAARGRHAGRPAARRRFAGSFNPAGQPSTVQAVKDSLNAAMHMRKASLLRPPNGALTHGL